MAHPRSARRIARRQITRRIRHAIAPPPACPVDRKALAGRLFALVGRQLEAVEARSTLRAEAADLRRVLAGLARMRS